MNTATKSKEDEIIDLDPEGELEVKAFDTERGVSQELESVNQLISSVEGFKVKQGERLADLERKLNAQELQLLDMHRPQLDSTDLTAKPETKSAMDLYLRKGKTELLEQLESKGMYVGSDTDGGYLVPSETETNLLSRLREDSPIRSLASTITITTTEFKQPVVVSGASAGWVAETGARPETAAPQLVELSFPTMELYASPAASKRLLDDAMIDVDAWLTEEVNAAFTVQESAAFVNGDGVSMPTGFLAYPQAPAESATFGTVSTVSSGADAEITSNGLFDPVYSLGAKHRRNACFIMNRTTLGQLRKLTNDQGDYILQTGLNEGFSNRLLGFPVKECEDMPDVDLGTCPIAFGDFKRAYLIVDRKGLQVLRDPFSAKPYVMFYATKRVGGGIRDFDALRLLITSA